MLEKSASLYSGQPEGEFHSGGNDHLKNESEKDQRVFLFQRKIIKIENSLGVKVKDVQPDGTFKFDPVGPKEKYGLLRNNKHLARVFTASLVKSILEMGGKVPPLRGGHDIEGYSE